MNDKIQAENNIGRNDQNLWNPMVAVGWSILFTPVFGAWILSKNWTS
jgi:hypothetical protein